MRSGELTVRRALTERGLLLMASRDLVEQLALHDGFSYVATDAATPFLDMLSSQYITKLRARADWVVETFQDITPDSIRDVERRIHHGAWSSEFQLVEGVSNRRQ